jgi:hypothetical protein
MTVRRLRTPMRAPTTDFDREVLDIFVRAGRNPDLIETAHERLKGRALTAEQLQVVEDYYRGALTTVGGA